jgi:Flp pilus assembly protein TadB
MHVFLAVCCTDDAGHVRCFTTEMAHTESNDPDTGYSDAPGTRALVKGWAAFTLAVLLCLISLIAASLGVLPALVLLVAAVPLGIWGSHELKQNARQIRPDEPRPGKLIQ